ncbi:hypothetical protein CCMA1212_010144 [Trichoderma ghanense]|uniref:Uncharacterized protein n=1 Tax=Trichoderma ghanense TaxID=65468 RepID=A0ABY2GQC2_9HYPO
MLQLPDDAAAPVTHSHVQKDKDERCTSYCVRAGPAEHGCEGQHHELVPVRAFAGHLTTTTWQDFEAEAGVSGLSQCGAIIQTTIRLISKAHRRDPISPSAFASTQFDERCQCKGWVRQKDYPDATADGTVAKALGRQVDFATRCSAGATTELLLLCSSNLAHLLAVPATRTPLRKGSFAAEAPEAFERSNDLPSLPSPNPSPGKLPAGRYSETVWFPVAGQARRGVSPAIGFWPRCNGSPSRKRLVVQCQRFGEQPGELVTSRAPHAVQPVHGASMMPLSGIATPLVDFGQPAPFWLLIDAPWSTALFQCGSFSFAGEKAGWAPPQRASLVRCTATPHSTALHMWAWPGTEPVTLHTNFGAGQTGWLTGDGPHGNKGKLVACSFCSVHVSPKASCLPGMQRLGDRCLAEARRAIPSNFAGAALRL